MADALRLHDVGRSFGATRVLDGVSLTIVPGEFVALIGRSGSGKSTLLRIVAGLDRADGGQVQVPGRVAVAFQEPRLLPWRRVRANVGLGLTGADRDVAVETSLAEVGLTARAEAWPLTLSGGEAQRASLARALVRRPDLLLLDEPFSALDALTRLSVHELVAALHARHGWAALMVTHDVTEAIRLAHRVVVLDGGRIAGEVRVDDAGGGQHRRPELEDALLDLLGGVAAVPAGAAGPAGPAVGG
ncbi:MAG TPA: ABC transporter ATP-binding protein [Cellulomonas sp.]